MDRHATLFVYRWLCQTNMGGLYKEFVFLRVGLSWTLSGFSVGSCSNEHRVIENPTFVCFHDNWSICSNCLVTETTWSWPNWKCVGCLLAAVDDDDHIQWSTTMYCQSTSVFGQYSNTTPGSLASIPHLPGTESWNICAYITMGNVQHQAAKCTAVVYFTTKLMCYCHGNQHLGAVAMATRVLCIVAMETVTVQIQYLRRCSWSHKVATPGLINLHVHINHTAVHLHLNLKGSRITTYYSTTPNMCLLCYFTRRTHDIVGVSLSEYTKLQMWNRKLAAILR